VGYGSRREQRRGKCGGGLSEEPTKISQAPYPGPIAPGSRYFVSEYFHRFNKKDTPAIFAAFARVARDSGF
jgi:hypothetical protein